MKTNLPRRNAGIIQRFLHFFEPILARVQDISGRNPDLTFALVAGSGFVTIYNWRFWDSFLEVMPVESAADAGFAIAILMLLIWLHAAVLLIVPSRTIMRATTCALIIAGAICAFFADTYKIQIDRDMVRNVAQTDLTEAMGLLSPRFIIYLLLLGAAPVWLLTRVRLAEVSTKRFLAQRFAGIFLGAIIVAVGIMPYSGQFATFLRTHKPLRYLINPGNAFHATWRYIHHETSLSKKPLIDVDGVITRSSSVAENKPLLVVLVVGETARATNFQFLGHKDATTPLLGKREELYRFSNVSSCGTSTAISLPCIFSGLGRKDFDVGASVERTNLLDTLNKAGVMVEWRDNNTGCKGICERVPNVQFKPETDSALCEQDYCYDEILLSNLRESISANKKDQLRVLHQIGSHGPAYWRRYPSQFERFAPTCRTNDLSKCTKEEIHNTYDNTIVYTDYVLDRTISMLENLSEQYDTALLYISDHGESLGERGIYLHGAPYRFAPKDQKHVPMILWLSSGFQQRSLLSSACMRGMQNQPLSHDNIYHTILGMMKVRNLVYSRSQDMLLRCRQ
ncbi:MAG: phosphoethanolamine transferase [Janthinobacterium lividum]|uniref:Lipid A ethanolaminephosphotransferase n=1 Tax=Massilia yuzhufengensis TaxID=1164594 RepID=A0A1I1LSW9_9BURK|nr:phosphoethanolamine--lipid A transferase [Massilia yuzhufengensis]SFC76181.1 lipid A ethanolaminephosphotransferase [Massilia yuzhufengensis]